MRVRPPWAAVLVPFLCVFGVFSLVAVAAPTSPTLIRVGHDNAPELSRVYVDINRSNFPVSPAPRVKGNEVHVYFPGIGVLPGCRELKTTGDNLVQEIRIDPSGSGVLLRVICRSGVPLRVLPLVENDVYYLEIERPAALRQRPEMELAEIMRRKEAGARVVIIDPGHGGRDQGTAGNGLIEKTEVLRLSRAIADHINRTSRGRIIALLTRTGDYNLASLYDDGLRLRLKRAAELQGDLFISIHLNHFRGSASGWEIHVPETYSDSRIAQTLKQNPSEVPEYIVPGETHRENGELNQFILNLVAQDMEQSDPSREWAGYLAAEMKQLSELRSRDMKTTNKYVTGNLAMPSVLLEVAFLSNAHDAALVRDRGFEGRLAAAVGNGAARYLFGRESELAEGLPVRTAPVVAQVASAATLRHKVGRNETVSSIARRYGVSESAIMHANGLTARSARRLRVGQTLQIPGGTAPSRVAAASPAPSVTHKVRSGESLSTIAKRYGVPVESVMSANGLNSRTARSLRVGQTLRVPGGNAKGASAAAPRSHTVRENETLIAIAGRYGVSVASLMSANNLSNRSVRSLKIGQELRIP